MTYEPTIGLEIHAELKTRTKMFCDSLNDPDEKHPNINVCPVCLGHPGALPVINKKAVEEVIRVGLALGGEIPKITKFDRKNYFYPDLPKGYQISQYDKPLVVGGELNGVRLERIHLEEDAGKLIHGETGDTLVDFNRAGVPLMELVTKPDIHNAEQAVEFAKELQLILKYLGASDADLEKGQMRADVNISVATKGELGTKVEIKNVNSFRSIAGAVKFEIERQRELLEKGEKIKQETRGWDDIKQKTVSQRSKEESHDYRYFPEPDLPPLAPQEVFDLEKMKSELPELPSDKRVRFAREFGLSESQSATLVENKFLADYFEVAVSELESRLPAQAGEKAAPEKKSEELLFNYLTSDLVGLINDSGISYKDLRVKPAMLSELVDFIVAGKVTTRQAKDILKIMFDSGESPENILGQGNFNLVKEEVMHQAVEEVLKENPNAVTDFASGKSAALQFLVGKVMQKTKGGADPGEIQNKLLEKLKG